MKSPPFDASRTAAVATVRTVASISRATAANRRSAPIARLMLSASIAPVAARLRPRPAITFSLNSVAGTRGCP